MLTVISGPMFAGKTNLLLRYTENLEPNSFLVVTPTIGNKQLIDGDLKAITIPVENPYLNGQVTPEVSTVLFDGLNFYDLDLLAPLVENLMNRGINVVGAGLTYDYQKQPFGATLPLSEKAQKVFRLTAVCDSCNGEAEFSYRKIKADGQVLVGAEESYGACCKECWEKLTLN